MSQRTLAGVLAVPLLIGLWAAALFTPLPYVTYEPGITVDLLSETEDGELLQVQGHQTYRDDGEMLLTTVYVSRPKATVNLFEVVRRLDRRRRRRRALRRGLRLRHHARGVRAAGAPC